jgi:hypothetical protein
MEDVGRLARPVAMTNRKNDLMDLHPVAVVGSLLGARAQQTAAPRDAEPEVYEPRQSVLRRLVDRVRARGAAAASAESAESA